MAPPPALVCRLPCSFRGVGGGGTGGGPDGIWRCPAGCSMRCAGRGRNRRPAAWCRPAGRSTRPSRTQTATVLSGARPRVEVLPVRAEPGNPVVAPRPHGIETPAGDSREAAVRAALEALRSAVDRTAAGCRKDAAAAAWRAEPVVRSFCATYGGAVAAVRVNDESFVVITAEVPSTPTAERRSVEVFDAAGGRLASLNREARRIVESLRTPGRSSEQLLEAITFRRAVSRFRPPCRGRGPAGRLPFRTR